MALLIAQSDPCARKQSKGVERGEGGCRGDASGRVGCNERGAAWGGLVRRSGGAMLVARGRGAAHALEEDDGSARSFTTAGALREVVPPPYRLGVSNPDPYRLFADRGARLAVVFLIEDPGSR